MQGKTQRFFGIYPADATVESGVDALRAAGFRSADISVLFPENSGTKDFTHAKGTKAPGTDRRTKSSRSGCTLSPQNRVLRHVLSARALK